MARRPIFAVVNALLLGVALSAIAFPVARAEDQRPTGPVTPPQPQTKPQSRPEPPPKSRRTDGDCPPPCPPVPCPPDKPDKVYEITILSVDADRAAVPTVSALLAGISNPKEQRAALQAQAKRGLVILQVSGGPTLHIAQDATGTRDADAGRSRITAHPHLNAGCAEAIDFLVEQAPHSTSQTGIGTRISLVFENGDTKLLSETARPDGTRHLLYATVYLPPCPSLADRR